MATATKAKKATPISKVASEYAADYIRAEVILQDSIQSDTPLTHAERTFLKTRLGWDEKEQDRQAARISTVARWQAVVGTQKDRDALADATRSAFEKLATVGPEIESQVKELQAKLATLERDHRQLEKRATDIDGGLKALSLLAPAHVTDECNQRKTAIKESVGKDYQDLKTEIQHGECLADPQRYETERAYVDVVRAYDWNAVEDHSTKDRQVLKLSPTWEKKRKAIEKELPSKRKRLEQLKHELETELKAIAETLKCYHR